MNVPQSTIAAALAAFSAKASFCAKNEGKYQLPDGSCTDVHPSLWAWQCGPGVGSEASCVGVPEVNPFFQVPTNERLPTQIAPPLPVVQAGLFQEATDRYATWSSCHSVAPTLDQWLASLPKCGEPGAGAASPGAAAGGDAFGSLGCLFLGIALLGAAADVFGGHR